MSNISFSILLSNKSITEGSCNCIVWKALFGVFFCLSAFLGVRELLRRNVNNLELVNGHNSKGDYAQSEDSADEAQTDDTGVVGAVEL